MSLRVVRPGVLTTVQDLGRPGRQTFGVPVGGAMDSTSLRVANWLVGNDDGAAALECTLVGPTLLFTADALVACFGGGFTLQIDSEQAPAGKPIRVRKGVEISLRASHAGCRGYLAVAGGIDVPAVIGSRGTYLRAGVGGFEGRALRLDDCLAIAAPSPAARRLLQELSAQAAGRPWQAPAWGAAADILHDEASMPIRVLLGAQFAALTPPSRLAFFSAAFAVTPQSDRMGFRLGGPALSLDGPREMLSTAVCPGTIQLPPAGQPILLMADAAPTGGYPVIAHVASVDLPRVAQRKPGDLLYFQEISLDTAQSLYRAAAAELQTLKAGIELKFDAASARSHVGPGNL